MRLHIIKTKELNKIKEIRTEIFEKELGISKEKIFDIDDNILDQFLIINGKDIIGSFRLRDEPKSYRIERMGILSQYRSKGFGNLSLEEIKKYSSKKNKSKLILDSIYNIRDFYKKVGFVEVSDIFFKAGLPHVKMEAYLR